MSDISHLKIKGLDELRPPMIRKEPYINLYFKMSQKAPKQWCEGFNDLVAKGKYPAKIDSKDGLIIETWVRKADEIEDALKGLQTAVRSSTINYLAKIEAEANAGASTTNQSAASGEQLLLNQIVRGLRFDD